jgi:hypothetical protein
MIFLDRDGRKKNGERGRIGKLVELPYLPISQRRS